MQSQELKQQISVLQANVLELGELVVLLRGDPILRAKMLARLAEQTARLNYLVSFSVD
jgi:hypothetical protein